MANETVKRWSEMSDAERAEFVNRYNDFQYGPEVVCLGNVNDPADMERFGEMEWTVAIRADGALVATPHLTGAVTSNWRATYARFRKTNPPIVLSDVCITYMRG